MNSDDQTFNHTPWSVNCSSYPADDDHDGGHVDNHDKKYRKAVR